MQHIEKRILVFKPDYLESNTDSDAALSLFNRDARMHILKCKEEENRNKILRNRLFRETVEIFERFRIVQV